MHRHTVRVPGYEDHLSGVAADADVEAKRVGGSNHAPAAANRSRRAFEQDQKTVPGGVELPAPMMRDLLTHGCVVDDQQVVPCLVADTLEHGGGANDVGEKQGE